MTNIVAISKELKQVMRHSASVTTLDLKTRRGGKSLTLLCPPPPPEPVLKHTDLY
jgi:hypothetical protein